MIVGFLMSRNVTYNYVPLLILLDNTIVISLLVVAMHEVYYVAAPERLHMNEFEEKLNPDGNAILTEESTYR